MRTILKKFELNYPRISEILRFLIVGGIATFIDMVVMAFIMYLCNTNVFDGNFINVFLSKGLASNWSVVLGTAIGFIVGLVINYLLSLSFVYHGDNAKAKTKKGFILFLVLSAIGLIIQTVGIFIGYGLLNFNEWIVKIILVVVVLIFNYITRKKFIFNESTKRNDVNNIIKEKVELTEKEKRKLTKTIFICLAIVNFFISTITIKMLNGVQYGYFFGDDSSRVLADWSAYNSNHYRTKVHPLYVLFIFPFFKIMELLGSNTLLTAAILISTCVTFSEILLYKILNKLNKKFSRFYPILFTLFYCICFSTIENLLVVESFSISSVSLLLYFDWYTSVYNKEFKFKDYCLLSIMGIVCFSIVLTNLIIYLITIGCLLFNKKRKFVDYLCLSLKLFCSFACMVFISLILCNIQFFIFKSSKNAMIYLINIFRDFITGSRNSEEFAYMSPPNIHNATNSIKGFLGFTFCGGNLFFNGVISYFKLNVFSLIMIISIATLIIISAIVSIKNKNYIIIPFLLSYVSQVFLHVIYGNAEIMLYTFQSLFLVFLIFQCGVPYLKEKLQKPINIWLTALISISIIGTMLNILQLIYRLYVERGFNSPIFYDSYDFLINLGIIIIFVVLSNNLKYCIFNKGCSDVYNKEKCIKKFKSSSLILSALFLSLILAPFALLSINSGYLNKKQESPETNIQRVLMGMGQREKFVLTVQDGIGTFSKYDINTKSFSPIYTDLENLSYDAENYVITAQSKNKNYIIYEDENGIYSKVDNVKTTLDESNYINIPSFKEYSHMREMKVLFHEVLVNALPTGLTPNFLTYGNVWYRDSAIMAMVFEKTNNKSQVKIVANKDDVYDNARGGVKEPDNLGELLYLLSLQDTRDNELIDAVLKEAKRIKQADNKIHGLTDGTDYSVYQTMWLKFGMERLGLDSSEYDVSNCSDSYSEMCWFYQNDKPENYPLDISKVESELFNIKQTPYPYLNIAKLHYYKVKINLPKNLTYPISFEFQDWGLKEQARCSPHGWTAAELFLYLMDYDSF